MNGVPEQTEGLHSIRSIARSPWAAWLLLLIWWAGLRVIFFTGFVGSDDYFHLQYAIRWDAPPSNHWESRLAFNAILRFLIHVLGYREWVCAAPSLAGSLLLVAAAARGASLMSGGRADLLAAWIAASMPLDVVMSTVSGATALSAGFAGWFFVQLLSGGWVQSAVWGAVAGAVHPASLHFVLAAAVVMAVFRKQFQPVAAAVAAAGLYLLLDIGINALFWSDPLGGLRILAHYHVPDPVYRTFSAGWFLYPFQCFVFSKEFGFTVLLSCCAPLFWPAVRQKTLICAATVFAFWFWVGFGSMKPTEYEPFWRMIRLQYPLIVPASMVLAAALPGLPVRVLYTVGVLSALHVLQLAGSGPWGESVEISRRFLDAVRNHPDGRFLTDLRTKREMIGLNGFRPIGNLRAWPEVCRSREAAGEWFLVENPLNLATYGNTLRPRPLLRSDGPPLMRLEAVPRRIFAWAPRSWLARYPVLVRRPEARLLPVVVSGCQD